jgi:hypothetical protein
LRSNASTGEKEGLLILLLNPTPTPGAQSVEIPYESGNQLYDALKLYKQTTSYQRPADYHYYQVGYAAGYIAATVESNASTFCVPPAVTLGQGMDIVLQFLETHPELRHQSTSVLIILATREKFSCSKK